MSRATGGPTATGLGAAHEGADASGSRGARYFLHVAHGALAAIVRMKDDRLVCRQVGHVQHAHDTRPGAGRRQQLLQAIGQRPEKSFVQEVSSRPGNRRGRDV